MHVLRLLSAAPPIALSKVFNLGLVTLPLASRSLLNFPVGARKSFSLIGRPLTNSSLIQRLRIGRRRGQEETKRRKGGALCLW